MKLDNDIESFLMDCLMFAKETNAKNNEQTLVDLTGPINYVSVTNGASDSCVSRSNILNASK